MATNAEVITALRHLFAGFPQVNLSETTVEAYIHDLADLDAVALMEAAREMRKRWRWMPTIAEIREVATEAQTKLRRAEKERDILAEQPPEPSPEAKRAVRELLRKLSDQKKG